MTGSPSSSWKVPVYPGRKMTEGFNPWQDIRNECGSFIKYSFPDLLMKTGPEHLYFSKAPELIISDMQPKLEVTDPAAMIIQQFNI